ncbi:hypothetical protein ABB37_05646 [Leptomonas pyrrhocoris]|uniref:Mnd1 HTH domain-containing protein n=1 Tax=Leptomonas pyrrhocoris TaxID=157538 RepID=A0A0M9FZK2_LEPPY|nr:hypothetical protein ABB37_05646 [Leptomonas pyrrhocoris]KPA79137.1 hypothetical protein ABB37_05646 [Leptomonas pyrrhocoris]|eukprot:XP_015657576.1 hypothetical protein ABB37_05646 [Leptomonas pyrrhocoris]
MCAATAKKRKGLSLEEKVVLVERWITAHPQPYTMKELQQLIPKQTPVIYQSVEECVLLLVSENRVQQDRVGVSTLFWKFPLTEAQKLKPSTGKHGGSGGPLTYAELLRRLTCGEGALSSDAVERACAVVAPRQLREWHTALQAEHAKVDAFLATEHARVGFTEEGPLQSELAHRRDWAAQRTRLLAQQKAMSTFQSLPDLLRRLAEASAVAMEAANRWTDNYYLAEMELVSKTGQSQRDVRAALQVPPDMDFLSDEEDEEAGEVIEFKAGVNSSTLPYIGEVHAKGTQSWAPSTAALPAVAAEDSRAQPPPIATQAAPSPAPAKAEATPVNAASVVDVETADNVRDGTSAGDIHAGAADLPAWDTNAASVEHAEEEEAPAKETGRTSKPAPKRRTTRKRAR